jgi:hypothetical protein
MLMSERLANAWKQTPTKWYPLPAAVGALLLVVIQYRKKVEKEVHVDENGNEIIRLKGPWTVCLRVIHLDSSYLTLMLGTRYGCFAAPKLISSMGLLKLC